MVESALLTDGTMVKMTVRLPRGLKAKLVTLLHFMQRDEPKLSENQLIVDCIEDLVRDFDVDGHDVTDRARKGRPPER